MLTDSFFGILLHTRVNGGIDAKTILIEIVWCAVWFVVLVAETIERILFPLAEVDLVLQHIPLGIVALFRLFGS